MQKKGLPATHQKVASAPVIHNITVQNFKVDGKYLATRSS